MSASVGASGSNPYAYLQYLLQQQSSQSGTTDQSSPLSTLLADIGQAGTSATSSSSSGTASTSATSGSTSPQFDPQTFQALFDAQMSANGTSDSQPAWQGGQGDGSSVGG